MIVAVGIDLVDMERIRHVLALHGERFRERHFTPVELEYCRVLKDPAPSLAARFAAKEAFQKCWPRSFGWRDVWVERQPGKRPVLAFNAAIAQEMREEGLKAHLSLSHSRDAATAVVVLERLPHDAAAPLH